MKKFLIIYPEIQLVNDRLKSLGFQFFLVGGCVRDFLLGEDPKDIDVVTNALPDQVEEIFQDFKILTIGKSFGIIKIIFPSGIELEVATFRKDLSAGRRPDSVVFTTAEEDVKRRDFTINGLLYNIDKDQIIDFVGGQQDLQDKILRTIGDATERFSEDPLRKLRALRFSNRLDFRTDPNLYGALKTNNSLEGVSEERIVDELTKAFAKAKTPTRLSLELNEFGFDQIIFGKKFKFDSFEVTNSISIALSKLFSHLSAKEVHNMLKLCKFPTYICDRVEFLIGILKLSSENFLVFKKRQKSLNISTNYLLKFLETFTFSLKKQDHKDFIQKLSTFIDLEPSINSTDVISDGFKGSNISVEIARREGLKFQEALNLVQA